MNLVQKIRSIYLLSEHGERKLLDCLRERHIEKNSFLLSPGQVCKHIWFIEQGFARSVCFNDTKEVSTGFYIKGDFVTNLNSLRNGTPSEYEIQVTEPSIVLSFEKQTLMGLYEASHEIARFGRGVLEQLLNDQEEHANLFKLKTPAERYSFLLKNRPFLFQKATLTQIASYIGVSRETLSRIRGHV
ncbi:Crp/Fnr family transcriptional regulator [Mucilaginibacter sp. 21P]|uniref:Crp/Fnr family transcriptional regulator n=1 Tax=Mucilaginibacter sp. 21P TaxID=2778902 RepID=UPI001C590A1D|nr:Crp/Fnr family transcriptional regulator [Mucilaginibacter sp. 21P]QXV63764.1 Crp/Fnr family transcriptional regulator [Mucilaginibacter sp. 21P]